VPEVRGEVGRAALTGAAPAAHDGTPLDRVRGAARRYRVVMPLQRIDVLEGRPESQRRAIADAVHRALVESIGVPQDDRFQVVTEHPRAGFLCTPAYLGIRYESPVLLQLTISTGRTTEQKQRLYARLAELLADAGVAPSDVVVNLVEVARDDWSFGNGIAQYVPAPRT
jgi:4-oxalocrotonate tautomerase